MRILQFGIKCYGRIILDYVRKIIVKCTENGQLLGALARLEKATTSFIVSIRLSARNNSDPSGRICMKTGN
jgi:hypothetical protein